jgi:triphosphatase
VPVPKEIELKLEVPPANLPRLAKIPRLRALKTPAKSATEISVYFDAENRKLHKKGLMLRVRHVGNRYVQTIKSAGHSDLFERDEWESEIDGAMPDLRLAQGTALEPLLSRKFCRQLKPVFETRVRRKTYPLTNGNSDIALTLDKGEIDTGDRSKPLCEIELELKRGHEAELFEVAREVTHAVAGQLALKSKSERGYELLEGSEAAPVKAAPIDLSRGTSTRDAFKAIGLACLKQVIDNVPALLAGDPEGVHQMRVGLRRLRAGDLAVRRYSAGPANGRVQRGTEMADRRAWPRARARSAGNARGHAGETAAFAIAGNFESLARSHAATRGGARTRAGCGTVGAVSCTDARDCRLAGSRAVEETARRPRPRSW